MGGCAGKPRDLDLDEASAPVEAPATPAAPKNTLLDLSERAPEATENDEITPATEAKPVLEELVPVESKPEEAKKPAEAVEVVKEEKKNVAETVAVSEKPEAEAAALKSEEKIEAPLVKV